MSSYAAACEEHGWDSLPALQAISDDDLKQLVADVEMKSGHAARLRSALGKAPPAAAAPPAQSTPGAVPAVPAAPAAGQPGQGVPAAPSSVEAAAAQKKLHDKLLKHDLLGGLEHGTTIQTYQMPNNGSVTLRVMCNKVYFCLVCPVGQKLAANNGARACGLAMCNAIDHLASNIHWTHWRKAAFDLPYDEAAWTQFTMNNKHGPSRALKTQQYAQRSATKAMKREQQRTSGNPTPTPGMWTSGSGAPGSFTPSMSAGLPPAMSTRTNYGWRCTSGPTTRSLPCSSW